MELTDLLAHTAQVGASDLHLSAGVPPLLRLHGEIVPISDKPVPPLTREQVMTLILSAIDEEQRAAFERTHELDFSIGVQGVGRFRGNAYMQVRGPAAVFRVIPDKIPAFDSLGLPPVVRQLALKERGLVLVTGPTGSGKSTTLAAMIDVVNSTKSSHIITIEDPVEFLHQPKYCLVNQREIGAHTNSFAAALRAALREDPDILLVGEMRDLETISLALTAAETGHLVFATLHTSGAAKTIDRIVNVFPAGEQDQVRTALAGSIQGIVSQALLRRDDRPGRVGAHEILVATPAVRALVRENKTHQIATAIQTGMRYGMQSLEQSLTSLVMARIISRETAEAYLVEIGATQEQETGLPQPPPEPARQTAPVAGAASPPPATPRTRLASTPAHPSSRAPDRRNPYA